MQGGVIRSVPPPYAAHVSVLSDDIYVVEISKTEIFGSHRKYFHPKMYFPSVYFFFFFLHLIHTEGNVR